MNQTRVLVFLAILATCVGCDHATKLAANSLLGPARSISLAAGAVHFELAYNPGAFLSLGAQLPPVLRSLMLGALAPLVLLFVCGWFLRTGTPTLGQLVGLGLIAGGGLGNTIDRLLHRGLVTDFVSLGFGPLRTGIFNVADVAIVAGVLLLLVATREPRPTPE